MKNRTASSYWVELMDRSVAPFLFLGDAFYRLDTELKAKCYRQMMLIWSISAPLILLFGSLPFPLDFVSCFAIVAVNIALVVKWRRYSQSLIKNP